MAGRTLLERIAGTLLRKCGYTLVLRKPGCIMIGANWRLRYMGSVSSLLRELSLSQHLQELLTDLEIDCVLDVGANAGQYGQFLREQVGYRGLILSFEPVPDTYSQLCGAARGDLKWKTFCVALGRENQRRSINVMKSSQLNSFLQPAAGLQGVLGEVNVVEHTEIVEVRRLADLMPSFRTEFGFARPYLKLDTQGFDLDVIAGAGTQLEGVVAMQTEMSVQPTFREMPSYRESLRTLEERGFVISNMFLVSTQAHRMVEFDCVMVRKP